MITFIAKTQINPFTPNNVSLSVVNEKNTISGYLRNNLKKSIQDTTVEDKLLIAVDKNQKVFG